MDLNKFTMKELRQLAKDAKLKGYSKYNKAPLIEFINQNINKNTQRNKLKKISPRKLNLQEETSKPRKKKKRKTSKRNSPLINDFGGYKILKRLGYGTYANTYLGEKNGKLYTIKELKKLSSTIDLYSEILSLKRILPCDGVPRFHSAYIKRKTKKVYLIMEYVKGMPLIDFINKLRMDDKIKDNITSYDLKNIMIQLASTLKCVHEHNRIHRDIKDDNVIIDVMSYPPKVTLIDFGLSCFYKLPNFEDLLKGGIHCYEENTGNKGYYPPETFDIRSVKKPFLTSLDVFALGVLFLNLTTNKANYAKNLPEKIKTGSSKLNSLIRNMTSSTPSKRPTMDNVLKRLKRIPSNQNYKILLS